MRGASQSILTDAVESVVAAEIESVIGDGRGCGDLVAEFVFGEDFEFFSGFDYGDGSVSGGEEDAVVGGDGIGSVGLGVDSIFVVFSPVLASRQMPTPFSLQR